MSLKAVYIHILAVNHLGCFGFPPFFICDNCIGFIGCVFRNLTFVGREKSTSDMSLHQRAKLPLLVYNA